MLHCWAICYVTFLHYEPGNYWFKVRHKYCFCWCPCFGTQAQTIKMLVYCYTVLVLAEHNYTTGFYHNYNWENYFVEICYKSETKCTSDKCVMRANNSVFSDKQVYQIILVGQPYKVKLPLSFSIYTHIRKEYVSLKKSRLCIFCLFFTKASLLSSLNESNMRN